MDHIEPTSVQPSPAAGPAPAPVGGATGAPLSPAPAGETAPIGAPVGAPVATPGAPVPQSGQATVGPVKALCDAIRAEVSKAVVGQEEIVGQFLMALLVGGHVLLEGVPGVAKTLTAKSLANAFSAGFKRIQFTPDLMPADVVGTNVFDVRTQEFVLQEGPVFTDFLLADEINRTPPKTQASLLEAMQEKHVTIDGDTRPLSSLFTVFATQNPVDYEGTYPLPEAQIDRFLIKVTMTYLPAAQEIALLERVHRGFDAHEISTSGLRPIATPEALLQARRAVKQITVSEGMIRYIVQIVTRTRDLPTLTLGASPRAGIALLECSKALAAMNGRDYVIPEDIKMVAFPVLRHRLILRAESEMEGLRSDDVIRSLVSSVEVPR